MHLQDPPEYCIKAQDYELNSAGPENLKLYE